MAVVAGIDNSPSAVTVIERAIAEAGWRGTELKIVHVVHIPYVYTEAPIAWDEVAEAERVAVWERVADAIAGSAVPIETIDLEGYPPDTLVGYANDIGAELLVVGTRGRGGVASLVLGSTSHRAIHLAESDVLVVKPTE